MAEQDLPLVAALQHLHIRMQDEDLARPESFARTTRLMQGDREIPQASDAEVEAFVKGAADDSGPQAEETGFMFLRMAMPDWPEVALCAVHGLTEFGAKSTDKATKYVARALNMDRRCTLARQTVLLIAAGDAVRKEFGVDLDQAPDVVAIIGSLRRSA